MPDEYLKYTQLIKNRQRRKLQNIEKRIIFGKDIDQSEISTSLLKDITLLSDRITIEYQGKQ